MKRIITGFCFLGICSGVASVQAAAADVEALAKAKNCFVCHSVDKKMIGPSYKDVAAKYKGQAGMVTKLSDKVIKGGVGVWGQVPMPPNNVTPAEAKQLVEWVLKH